jgi:hypothetical protein
VQAKENKGKVRRSFILAILMLYTGILILMAIPDFPVVAQEVQTILRFTPSGLGLRPEAQGTINIVVENVQDLYGVEFHLDFDPLIVQGIDSNPEKEGFQIQPADWWKDGFVAINSVDNKNGRIDFAATLLRPARAVSGNLTIATITFAARQTGTSTLSFHSAILATGNAQELPYTRQEGKIGVNPGGKAPNMHTGGSLMGSSPGKVALAGAAILAFLAAMVLFIFALTRRK